MKRGCPKGSASLFSWAKSLYFFRFFDCQALRFGFFASVFNMYAYKY
jgi:hypothetical protein